MLEIISFPSVCIETKSLVSVSSTNHLQHTHTHTHSHTLSPVLTKYVPPEFADQGEVVLPAAHGAHCHDTSTGVESCRPALVLHYMEIGYLCSLHTLAFQ